MSQSYLMLQEVSDHSHMSIQASKKPSEPWVLIQVVLKITMTCMPRCICLVWQQKRDMITINSLLLFNYDSQVSVTCCSPIWQA